MGVGTPIPASRQLAQRATQEQCACAAVPHQAQAPKAMEAAQASGRGGPSLGGPQRQENGHDAGAHLRQLGHQRDGAPFARQQGRLQELVQAQQ